MTDILDYDFKSEFAWEDTQPSVLHTKDFYAIIIEGKEENLYTFEVYDKRYNLYCHEHHCADPDMVLIKAARFLDESQANYDERRARRENENG